MSTLLVVICTSKWLMIDLLVTLACAEASFAASAVSDDFDLNSGRSGLKACRWHILSEGYQVHPTVVYGINEPGRGCNETYIKRYMQWVLSQTNPVKKDLH